MSDKCCLPFDVTFYIFKVSAVIVFIKLFIQCNEIEKKANCLTIFANLKIFSELNYPETKCLF